AYLPQFSGQYASVATLPLYLNGEPAGVFMLYASRREAFDHEKEMALLKEMSGDISFALMHREQAQKADYLAYFDSVTALPNRALFADRLDQAVADARRGGESIAVVVLDLDRFKAVNDSFGHALGDDYLRAVAARLRESFDS